jgi:hypothetical protein
MGLSLVFLTVQYIAGYPFPNHFLLSLNLFRSIQFVHFFLIGYTTWLVVERCRTFPAWAGFILAMLFANITMMDLSTVGGVWAMIMFIGLMESWANGPPAGEVRLRRDPANAMHWRTRPIGGPPAGEARHAKHGGRRGWPIYMWGLGLVIALGLMVGVFAIFKINPLVNPRFLVRTGGLTILMMLIYFLRPPWPARLRHAFVMIPLILFTFWYTEFHYHQITDPKKGFELIEEHWEDMQRKVRERTPKDAMILVPYDMEMGGFRTLSERNVICEDRDKNIVAFDFMTARMWQQRRADILEFRVLGKDDYRPAVVAALTKYRADYIVFMSYKAPQPNDMFKLVYANGSFALFRVQK